ncbi:MAG: sulfide-dependent adenosine diphosphate thiazole synthase [Acidilobaceae archaeon]|nr:sulfide-dependent adenosine diphosphate thiazole synthase [Acidilobaceae archaeon]
MREADITRAIVRAALRDLEELSEVDVAVVGAGPSGLTAAYYLAKEGLRVAVFERRFSFGGGIGPGGNMLPRIVIQEEALGVLAEFGVRSVPAGGGLYVVDPAELIAKLAYKAVEAGAKVLLGAHVSDLIYRKEPPRITGVVWVWSPIEISQSHVDPIFTESKAVIDATGHGAEVLSIAARKVPELGLSVKGERSAYAELAERLVAERSGRVAAGLYVAGMATAAYYGFPRMGPIFGGMLLSGKKVAESVARDLRATPLPGQPS